MAFSKVTLNGETLMDVTNDTVDSNNMLYGTRGTAANGTTVTGAVVTTPVDSTLDTTSHNAIENAAVANALNSKIVAYTTTLAAASWSNTTPSTYTYSNASLTCGPSGTVPPIVTCTSNETEYSTISSASATPRTGITFTAPSAPTSAIDLIIIDFK